LKVKGTAGTDVKGLSRKADGGGGSPKAMKMIAGGEKSVRESGRC
jgi:hypothetical protein